MDFHAIFRDCIDLSCLDLQLIFLVYYWLQKLKIFHWNVEYFNFLNCNRKIIWIKIIRPRKMTRKKCSSLFPEKKYATTIYECFVVQFVLGFGLILQCAYCPNRFSRENTAFLVLTLKRVAQIGPWITYTSTSVEDTSRFRRGPHGQQHISPYILEVLSKCGSVH